MRFCLSNFYVILVISILSILCVLFNYYLGIYINEIQKLNKEVVVINQDLLLLRKELSYFNNLERNTRSQKDKTIRIPKVKSKRILVTGGAGFIGSHLIDDLILEGNDVIVIDNFATGKKSNIEKWLGHPNFEFIHHDIINPIWLEVDQIYHLASPASPTMYMKNPIKTIKTNTMGTINMLGLAKRNKAVLLLASTSEIYGDPNEHPQKESYFGNVNVFGPRSCYDEGKRLAESLCYAYNKQDNVSIRIARIFNTFGPRMRQDDGRVVTNFIYQSLNNRSLTIYGSGFQTRSFQYISDLIDGLKLLMNSTVNSPVNLGNPDEQTILELSKIILNLIPGSTSKVVFNSSQQDDPQRRLPDISKAIKYLNWYPKISLTHGLRKTIEYMQHELFLDS